MSNNTQPEIRFPGFMEDWEQRKLGELAESFEYGLNASAKKFDGSNKYIRITDIDDISHKFNQSGVTSPDIDFASADNYKLKKGDILFARTGASVGKTYMYRESDGLVYYAGFLIRARIKSKISSEFVFQTTFTDSYNRFIKITSQRSGQPGVNAEEYSNFKIMIPNYEEQNAIGCFFKKIDDTITLHQRKLDLLKETKKGFLQKMFPKNGAKVPEIRFPGFTGDWEQCKLGDIAKMYQPPTISGSELLDTGYPVFGANGYIGFYSKSNHLEDQVTISARGEGTGTPSYVKAPVWITGNSMVINVEDFDINKKFLYAMLLSYSLKKYITGGAQPQLTRDVLLKVPIIIPSYNEQFKIGTFFKQLDDTIALQQRKLDLLKETKKGFLQKMFV
ncbi:restriction endonuclease subunit S [Enterococcus faecium]|uniref:restriction endonuclease subunit S n=1 Tax=Enterococcus faecium TaxID=1352 RepID=UPI00398F84AA